MYRILVFDRGPKGVVIGGRMRATEKIRRPPKERKNMLNFEEELKKFSPSLEIDDAEDAIYNNTVTDITDILFEALKNSGEEQV